MSTQGFRGDRFFLSNFYPSPIQQALGAQVYTFATAEHVFHLAKAAFSTDSNLIMDLAEALAATDDPGEAKRLGRRVPLRSIEEWNQASTNAMWWAISHKFNQNPDLAERLLATGDEPLIEYNSWGDEVWGVNERTGKGQNRLGILLMKHRDWVRGLRDDQEL